MSNAINKPSLGSFKKVPRKPVGGTPLDQVKTTPANDEREIPLMIEPAIDGLDLIEWSKRATADIEALLGKHRALLFRNFKVDSVDRLQRFVEVTSEGKPLEYRDRSTPRFKVGNGVYVSTIYPPDQHIRMHNEGTYWQKWAQKIYFCCLRAATEGGETPIADVRKVLARIPAEVRQRFLDLGVMYVRNYNDGLGLPWQEVFQMSSPSELEDYCAENNIELEWKGEDRLRTRQIRPAIRFHPITSEPLWFNHAAFFHITAQEPEMRDAMLRDFAVEDLPYNTYFGDGSAIEPELVELISQAYEAEKVLFQWHSGDLLLLDNMTIAHGREPYVGEREVVVAMAEPTADSPTSTPS